VRRAHLEQSLETPYTFVMLGNGAAPKEPAARKHVGSTEIRGTKGRLLFLLFLFLFLFSPILEIFSTVV